MGVLVEVRCLLKSIYIYIYKKVLHIDPWLNRQSEILNTGHICEKISGSGPVVERKCVGLMKWYIQMPTWEMGSLWKSVWVSLCLGSQDHQRKSVFSARATSYTAAHSGSQRAFGWVSIGQEWKEMQIGTLKITARYGQEKKF